MALTVKELLVFMVKHDASDLYVTVGAPPSYRIQGVTQPAGKYKMSPEDTARLFQNELLLLP